jgi:peptidoglycan/LPS O-acetylase OafA/YrhL
MSNFQKQTVAALIANRNNDLTFTRLLLSLLVFYSHYYVLGGFGVDGFELITRGQDSAGGLAVKCFMILTGLLVSASFERLSARQYI